MNKPTIQITLTPKPQQQVRQASGTDVTRLKLEPLEDRVSPIVRYCF